MLENQEERIVKIGMIGVGGRAIGLLESLAQMKFVEVTAVCDIVEERMEEGVKTIQQYAEYPVSRYTDYHELLKRDDIEGVIIATSWNEHIKIAIASMRAGKYTAVSTPPPLEPLCAPP